MQLAVEGQAEMETLVRELAEPVALVVESPPVAQVEKALTPRRRTIWQPKELMAQVLVEVEVDFKVQRMQLPVEADLALLSSDMTYP
jgi:tRNA U38,U39,U40 pseudouridine synthase TruA